MDRNLEEKSLSEQLLEKWAPLMDDKDLPEIRGTQRRRVTAHMLENAEIEAFKEGRVLKNYLPLKEDAPINNQSGGNIAGYDPILIPLLRRSMPNLVAYDIMAVQPMTGPTGLIFALHSRYSNQTGSEAFYNQADTTFATAGLGGNSTIGQANSLNAANNLAGAQGGNTANFNYGAGMSLALMEALGSNSTTGWPEMSFNIERISVEAKGRALKASYSTELAQDLRAIHGLDAETELSNILATELLAEINREAVRAVIICAKPGATNTTVSGTFNLDVDSNGRWSVEKYKGLMMQLEIEANQIAKETRRGRGNIILCSSNVAAALNMAGILDFTPALQGNQLMVDDTGNTFVGILNGHFRVYIDPYAGDEFVVVGYRGQNQYDAGLFYCPYVPLQMARAIGQDSFQPRIGFKTRYGMVANPYSKGLTASTGALEANVNVYYRRQLITNIL